MPHTHPEEDLYVDANGVLVEHRDIGGQQVIVHYDDLPESDITTVDGIRVTTPLRTAIDVAPDLTAAELDHLIRHCLDRRMFTVEEAHRRLEQDDVSARLGARLVLAGLHRLT